jgi:beta-lysine 5,6-aminomutase beta subunit
MLVRPYGDTLDDGAVQLSFTLPLQNGLKAREAARRLVLELGFTSCEVVSETPAADGFTMYVVYARTDRAVDTDQIDVDDRHLQGVMDYYEVNDFIERHIGRKVVAVGACTGSDAHTIGIDAVMNMKGCNHHFGLERYRMVEAHNLGAQVENQALIDYAARVNADVILISQIVTQKEVHIKNLTDFIEKLDAAGLRERFITVVGGPRISNELAAGLGFDAGFGKGTYAEHVASFFARRLKEKLAEAA